MNKNFNDYPIPPKHVNEPHMPVIILCDTSGSMSGVPIRNVNLSVNRFAKDVCKDPKASGLVDVAVSNALGRLRMAVVMTCLQIA